jgi:hypothetical protein
VLGSPAKDFRVHASCFISFCRGKELEWFGEYEATNYMPDSASAWQQNCDGEFELSLFQELSLRKRLVAKRDVTQVGPKAFNGSTTRQVAVNLGNFNLEPSIGYLPP